MCNAPPSAVVVSIPKNQSTTQMMTRNNMSASGDTFMHELCQHARPEKTAERQRLLELPWGGR
jgi:hypothetical protein